MLFCALIVLQYTDLKWYKFKWKGIMLSSNRNIFRVTGPLLGESTGHRWIPLTKASDTYLWDFLWCGLEHTAE